MTPAFGTQYDFQWTDLGDIELGRPNLGQQMPVAVYRLAQYSMREALSKRYGDSVASDILRESGWIAGRELCVNTLDTSKPLSAFLADLQSKLKELGIGVMRIEHADLEGQSLTITVSEDLDCSGLPVSGTTVCDYDEGFIAGILHAYNGRSFSVKEIDCWATGDRTCRFAIAPE
ncbi:V4R domain-containing protein [Thiorhodococcus minor]|uniref:4-vinyl reductase n=1 Tax=Thiorhodococcus minor TaxID=57489 RepID=A0A6M0K474_9GAMM|nr:V4R domain-containing protein [Thiorhodococcus minor]NEV63397.1 4-vinyl reductase [Thiorhodococcus minor]